MKIRDWLKANDQAVNMIGLRKDAKEVLEDLLDSEVYKIEECQTHTKLYYQDGYYLKAYPIVTEQ